MTLPSKLNVAAYGPGHAPLRAYLVAPASMKSVCVGAIGETPNPVGSEFVPSVDDPFEVIVRAKISRVPFGCLPGLEEREAAFRQFRADAPRDRMWGYLESHGGLSPALDTELIPDANRTPGDTM